MSLENAILEHAAAIRELAAAMLGRPAAAPIGNVGVQATTPERTAKADDVELEAAVDKVVVDAKKQSDAKPAAAPAEGATSKGEAEEQPAITYEDVKKYIIALSRKSRESATGMLAKFGAAKGPELKPEQFAEFVTAAQSELGA
ncbi:MULTISPECIES: hypothetical protein [unclassified Janthinobacterium]|uniref:hypothetical protein n=1 Tax=unclassified Janthinobacterium TaxID=2610881 RepID=UPI00034A3149|nr:MULTISPECIES: hypothetical protein [unclassified Janthinobacterium]MEC5161698.1 hypothetical protein [Janthinobacterium sp. CG_S6]